MSRWDELTGGGTGAEYAARFARIAATGRDMHGEASLCASLLSPGARVLDAGCGTGRVAIRLAELGFDCVGADLDESMLAEARRAAPQLRWVHADLAGLEVRPAGFDLVVAAGNVVPLLAAGSEPVAIARMAAHLRPGGLLVAGFGLDAAHLPLASAPVDLPGYDAWCAGAGLVLQDRFATWDGVPYDGGGYAVSIHRLSSYAR
jgi:SAM-dependent methyltransferase